MLFGGKPIETLFRNIYPLGTLVNNMLKLLSLVFMVSLFQRLWHQGADTSFLPGRRGEADLHRVRGVRPLRRLRPAVHHPQEIQTVQGSIATHEFNCIALYLYIYLINFFKSKIINEILQKLFQIYTSRNLFKINLKGENHVFSSSIFTP